MRWITTEAFPRSSPPAEISLAALKVVKDAINNGTDPVEAKKQLWLSMVTLARLLRNRAPCCHECLVNRAVILGRLADYSSYEQGVTVPVFEPRPDARWVKHDGSYLPEGIVPGAKVVERPRRIRSVGPMRISDIKNDYFAFLESMHDKINTRRKWSRAVDRFVDLMGDLPCKISSQCWLTPLPKSSATITMTCPTPTSRTIIQACL